MSTEAQPTAERLDIEACEENLDHFARAGDARSCRDVGLALARELTTVRERADVLGDFAEWVVSLGEPLMDPDHTAERRNVDLFQIIDRAREVLGRKEG